MISIGRVRPSLNEFKVYFNDRTHHIRPKWSINKIEVFNRIDGERFFIPFSKTEAIFGCTAKMDGSINQIAFILHNDGTPTSKFEFLIAITLLMDALKPKMNYEKKSKLLNGIQFFNKEANLYTTQQLSSFEDLNLMLLSSQHGGFFSFCASYR